jgi:hypothetical protein
MTDPALFSSPPGKLPETASAETRALLLEPPQAPASTASPGRLHLWTHRISVFLFVLVSAVAGVLLIILPWTSEWADNYLLLSYPGLRTVVAHGFVRGVCSGLGMLDIWIGFWEALHYHEQQ